MRLTGRELEQDGLGAGAGSALQAALHGARQLRAGDEAAERRTAALRLLHQPLRLRHLRQPQARARPLPRRPPRCRPAKRQPAQERPQPHRQSRRQEAAAAVRSARRRPAGQHHCAAATGPTLASTECAIAAATGASLPPLPDLSSALPLYRRRSIVPPSSLWCQRCTAGSLRQRRRDRTVSHTSTPCRVAGPGHRSLSGAEVS